MSKARVGTLVASTIVSLFYVLGRFGGQHQDIVSENMTRFLFGVSLLGWFAFLMFTMEDRFVRRLEKLRRQILVYGDQRATDAHLEARRDTTAGNGHRADAAAILRQVGK